MLTALLSRYQLLQGLLDFIFPPLCSGCGSYTEAPGGVCEGCLEAIDWFKEPFCLADVNFAAGEEDPASGPKLSFPLFTGGNYTAPLKQIIINYKFRSATACIGLLAGRIVDQFSVKLCKFKPAMLVPIPLHPSREYRRGYNQATLFARELGRLLEMPVDEEILVRAKKRKPQARLREPERARNIRDVFSVSTGRTEESTLGVIIVDDVVTSGQTALEARKTLDRAGYTVVAAISIAHGL